MGTLDLISSATNLARNCGYLVFPCKEDKSPATPHGFRDATGDPAEVQELWRHYSAPLIGVATGESSGISVLDVDVKGDEARAWWRQNQHRVPTTRTYRTRSGGLHLVFQHAAGVKCAAGKPTEGIDVRGNGGYIVFWFAHGFECLDHEPPAPWPDWLTTYFWPAMPRSRGRLSVVPTSDKGLDAIVRTVREAREQTRNNKLHWAAHRMQERIAAGAITKADAWQKLVEAAIDAGLPEIESVRMIESAWRTA